MLNTKRVIYNFYFFPSFFLSLGCISFDFDSQIVKDNSNIFSADLQIGGKSVVASEKNRFFISQGLRSCTQFF